MVINRVESAAKNWKLIAEEKLERKHKHSYSENTWPWKYWYCCLSRDSREM